MANQTANRIKYMLLSGQIVSTDTFNIILMMPGFTFDPDSHHAYADVLASEVANGLGYTTGGAVLAGAALAMDNTEDRAELTFTDAQWDATGGSLVASGAIIYDDSTDTGGGDDHTDAIVGYIDAGGTIIASDGTPMLIQNIMVSVE